MKTCQWLYIILKFRLVEGNLNVTDDMRGLLLQTGKHTPNLCDGSYLSMITGSDGVSFLLPQLFLSQHRLKWRESISQTLCVLVCK